MPGRFDEQKVRRAPKGKGGGRFAAKGGAGAVAPPSATAVRAEVAALQAEPKPTTIAGAKARRARAAAVRQSAAAVKATAKRRGGSGSFDPEKHPRGADGKFISKAKVEELKAAGQWPPVPVLKPTKAKTARPKPQTAATTKAAQTPAQTQPVKVEPTTAQEPKAEPQRATPSDTPKAVAASVAKQKAELDYDLAKLQSEREAARARLDSAARLELDELDRIRDASVARDDNLMAKLGKRGNTPERLKQIDKQIDAENAFRARVNQQRFARLQEAAAVEAEAREARKVADAEIDYVGTVTEGFKDEVRAALLSVPEAVRQKVTAAGVRVVAAERLTKFDPYLAGVQPRGWEADKTWDNADGVYETGTKKAVVAERHFSKALGEDVSTLRAAGVLRHEYGHAVDFSLGERSLLGIGPRVELSSTGEFRRAYDADVADLLPAERSDLAYYVQPGHAGRQEAFAEAFASALGGGASYGYRGKMFGERFARTIAAVRSITGI